MNTITRYACSLCSHEFRNQQEAEACEALGTPESEFLIGSTMNVEIENNLGSRWSYGCESVTVIASKVVRLNDGTHAMAYGFDSYSYTRFAIRTPDRGIFSAYNW